MTPQPNSFDAELGQLADNTRRSMARDARRQRADRSTTAALSASFGGTLIELEETRDAATLLTFAGARIRGSIVAVGPELIAVDSAASTRTLIRIDALEAIREVGSGHDRDAAPITDGIDLGVQLDELAHERTRISITLLSGNQVMGVAERVGIDQLILRLDGEADVLTVPMAMIDHVVIER